MPTSTTKNTKGGSVKKGGGAVAAPEQETKPRRTSEGSGKTKGAVSLAYVNIAELLKIVREDAEIPIGRVFGEQLGFHVEQTSTGRPKLVLG